MDHELRYINIDVVWLFVFHFPIELFCSSLFVCFPYIFVSFSMPQEIPITITILPSIAPSMSSSFSTVLMKSTTTPRLLPNPITPAARTCLCNAHPTLVPSPEGVVRSWYRVHTFLISWPCVVPTKHPSLELEPPRPHAFGTDGLWVCVYKGEAGAPQAEFR